MNIAINVIQLYVIHTRMYFYTFLPCFSDKCDSLRNEILFLSDNLGHKMS